MREGFLFLTTLVITVMCTTVSQPMPGRMHAHGPNSAGAPPRLTSAPPLGRPYVSAGERKHDPTGARSRVVVPGSMKGILHRRGGSRSFPAEQPDDRAIIVEIA